MGPASLKNTPERMLGGGVLAGADGNVAFVVPWFIDLGPNVLLGSFSHDSRLRRVSVLRRWGEIRARFSVRELIRRHTAPVCGRMLR